MKCYGELIFFHSTSFIVKDSRVSLYYKRKERLQWHF
nr:MAG TPA: hypothetical protein [Caudoviricetes sp.]DAY74706.1 MAG TPA: hypothetical protein [Caudoviricetes sp.]